MKKFTISCDRGSLAIGNEDFVIFIPTNTGDGIFNVHLSRSHLPNMKEYDFVSCITGKCHIFNYDCLSNEDRARHIKEKLTVSLDGYYGVFRRKKDNYIDDFYIIKWS